MDSSQLPKGHVIGWTPPSQAATPSASKAGMTKAQKKNDKRKEKRKEKKEEEKVKDDWEDDDEGEAEGAGGAGTATPAAASVKREGAHSEDKPNWAVASDTKEGGGGAEALADRLNKLEVR